MLEALQTAGNPGRGAHEPTLHAARLVYGTREALAELFHAERLHINGVDSRRLRGIYDEQESMPFGKGRYPRQIGSISGHIGSMGDYDRLGIGAQQRFQLVVLQHTAGIDSQKA